MGRYYVDIVYMLTGWIIYFMVEDELVHLKWIQCFDDDDDDDDGDDDDGGGGGGSAKTRWIMETIAVKMKVANGNEEPSGRIGRGWQQQYHEI